MSDSPTITQQYSFAVGDDGDINGDIEPAEESVETSLEAFGASVDHRERDTRIDQPKATSFGIDDRPEVTRTNAGEQGALFVDTDDDQQTLTGKRAASQCLFETHDEPEDDRDDTPNDDAASEATTHPPIATDGGRVKNHDDDEDPDDHEDADSDTDAGFAVGARVTDRDADDPTLAVVVALPDEPAYACDIDALDGKSVADVNPNYPASGSVATVAYADDLDAALDVWRDASPDALARICADEGVRTYDFPSERLWEASMTDGGRESNASESGQDVTFDPDAETVTHAWEGAFIYASWGYDQTNIELAQITDVSDTGKTVLARKVGAERVERFEQANPGASAIEAISQLGIAPDRKEQVEEVLAQ